jgi:hypothetical protein
MTDDELGMARWNALSEPERTRWVSAAGTAEDAWELFEGKREQRADDPLADAHAALLRAIAELRAAGIAVPISLHQAVARADVRACESFAMTKRERVRGGRRL